jgi:hypothetical protein
VTLAGALTLIPGGPFFTQIVTQGFASVGFWLGIPLLATLSFGNEFQHQTFSLMLTQPIDRMAVWRDKMLVVLAAVLSAGGVYAIGYRTLISRGNELAVMPFIWVVVTVCSAVVCTLIARSTVGGMVLNFLHVVLIAIATVGIDRFLGPKPSPDTVHTAFGVAAAAAVLYGIVMVWIGRLVLARFQATGTANSDLLMSSPDALRAAFSGFLRCRPNSPISNLVLKELRLLGPLWLLAILFSLLLICLAPIQWMPGSSLVQANVQYIASVIVFLYMMISVLLAGCLSMGDERTLGTQLWHMTLPVSAGLQWLIKLGVAILATFVGLVFVFTVGQLIFGFPFVDAIDDVAVGHTLLRFLALSLLSFPAFWCACAVKGTIRAALWAIPASAATLFATRLGIEIAEQSGSMAPMQFIVSKFHLLRPMSQSTWDLLQSLAYGRIGPLGLLVIPIIVALVQSRRFFRREVSENSKSLVRALVWPVGIAFAFSFLLEIPRGFAIASFTEGRERLSSVFTQVQQLHLDLSQTDKTHRRQLTQAEIETVLSPDARLWLGEPSMSVYEEPMILRGGLRRKRTVLKANLSNGTECTVIPGINVLTGIEFSHAFPFCEDPPEHDSGSVRFRRWLHLKLK